MCVEEVSSAEDTGRREREEREGGGAASQAGPKQSANIFKRRRAVKRIS